MQTTTFDRKDWLNLRMDTPMSVPSALDRMNLMPGTCVKSKKRCGIVAKHDPMDNPRECVVIGHGWNDTDDEKFVWRGSLFDSILNGKSTKF